MMKSFSTATISCPVGLAIQLGIILLKNISKKLIRKSKTHLLINTQTLESFCYNEKTEKLTNNLCSRVFSSHHIEPPCMLRIQASDSSK